MRRPGVDSKVWVGNGQMVLLVPRILDLLLFSGLPIQETFHCTSLPRYSRFVIHVIFLLHFEPLIRFGGDLLVF
jgi:hypothetical protein